MRNIFILAVLVLSITSCIPPESHNESLAVENYADSVKGDTKIIVSSADASSYQVKEGIENSYDGDFSTMYHSNYKNSGIHYFPITLTFNFTDADRIDYFVYTPRQSIKNGCFKEVEVLYKLQGQTDYTSYRSFDFGGSINASCISFSKPLIHPVSIRFVVHSGSANSSADGQGFASCMEMEFFKSEVGTDPAFSIFADKLMTTLKPKVKRKQIDTISNLFVRALATQILSDRYSLDFRLADYKAYKNPSTIGAELHIGDGYSNYENMTGIFLPIGKHVVIVDNLAEGKQLSLWIPRLTTKDYWGVENVSFVLKNGINVINNTSWDGLAYLNYYSETPEKENVVKVHFPLASVNGYFDVTKHKDEDFNRMLDNAVSPIFDCRGRHIQVMYPVSAFKKYAYGRGVELINNYDSLVTRQYRIMGFEKYKKVPDNRILARVNHAYYMYRDEDGVSYINDVMMNVADPDVVISGDPCWGFSHEVGHVHQLQPYFNWGGMGETSNNLVTMYVIRSFGIVSRLTPYYQKARAFSIGKNKSYLQNEDVFQRLVPFWQLQLFFASEKGGYPDFYPDLYETLRHTVDENPSLKKLNRRTGLSKFQLNFVKKACQVSKTDLTEFFDKWGFFYVGKFSTKDIATYNNSYTYTMTQAQVDACKAEIAVMKLPKPKDKTTGLDFDLTQLQD